MKPYVDAFFDDFPELKGRVGFVVLDETPQVFDRDVAAYFVDSPKKADCVRNKNGRYFVSLSGDDWRTLDVNFKLKGHTALRAMPIADVLAMDRAFVFYHETGHVIEMSRQFFERDGLVMGARDGEQFADAYAAIKLIQEFGAPGIAYVRAWADRRAYDLISQPRPMIDVHHFTSSVLDGVVKHVSTIGLANFKLMTPQGVVSFAKGAADAYRCEHFLLEHDVKSARLFRAGVQGDDEEMHLGRRFARAVLHLNKGALFFGQTGEDEARFTGPWADASALFRAKRGKARRKYEGAGPEWAQAKISAHLQDYLEGNIQKMEATRKADAFFVHWFDQHVLLAEHLRNRDGYLERLAQDKTFLGRMAYNYAHDNMQRNRLMRGSARKNLKSKDLKTP